MSVRIAVVSAGLSDPSSTRLLADRLAEAVVASLRVRDEQVTVGPIELRPLAHDITNAMLTGFTADRLSKAIDLIGAADAVIAVTPIFQAAYSGLFKSFTDVLTIEQQDALVGTPVLLGATAGTARHSLALESSMRPLFSYLGALTVPTAVFAASEDWGSTGGRDTDPAIDPLSDRVRRAADELADLVVSRSDRRRRPTGIPGASLTSSTDDEVMDFAQLLARRH